MSNNPRFLSAEIPALGGSITLNDEQSAHCIRVLRLKLGDGVSVINGKGCLAEGVLSDPNPRKTVIELKSVQNFEKASHVQLAFGITKPASLELIFRKCTELGVSSFQPLITDHSLHPGSWNHDRWHKIVVEACKQSQEVWFPEVLSPVNLKEWLKQRALNRSLVLCDELHRKSEKDFGSSGPTDILIGPEGGWSETERTLIANQNHFVLGLGPNRLRAETACLVALALVKMRLGEI